MPRKSAAALSIAAPLSVYCRVAPPRDLTPGQRNLWLATVNSRPAEWFGDEHIPLLVEYVRHVETSDGLARQIDAFDPAWMTEDEGLRRYEKLLRLRAMETTVINALARGMRMTQQSLYRADKAITMAESVAKRKPWLQSER